MVPFRSPDADLVHHSMINAVSSIVGALDGGVVTHNAGYVALVSPTLPVPMFNSILLTGGDDTAAATALPAAMAAVEARGLPFGLLSRSGRGEAAQASARAAGLTRAQVRPAMALEPSRITAPTPTAARVDVVRDHDRLAQAAVIAARAFGAPASTLDALYADLFVRRAEVTIYLATVEGVPVATALGWQAGGTVGLFLVATEAEHQGHGYGGAVTAAAAAGGFAAGARVAWLQSSDLGESVYRRLGFTVVDSHQLLTRPLRPDGNPAVSTP